MTNLYPDARPAELPERLPIPARALAIGAHPDDIEFGGGGTLARWAQAGCAVSMLILTDGSKGTWDVELSPAELVAMRRAEQEAAGQALGATEVVMLGHIDGELEYSMALREELCMWIRRLRPEVLLTHDPWRRYQLHPDHRVAGLGALDGAVAARDHLFFPHQLVDGLTKHRPEAILLWSPDQPDYWEDIAPAFAAKVAALLCHASQAGTSMGDASSGEEQRTAFVERIRAWAVSVGEPVGLALAESFKVLRP